MFVKKMGKRTEAELQAGTRPQGIKVSMTAAEATVMFHDLNRILQLIEHDPHIDPDDKAAVHRVDELVRKLQRVVDP
jgi:hypothetical protein